MYDEDNSSSGGGYLDISNRYSEYTHEELIDLLTNIIGYTHSSETCTILNLVQEHMESQNSEIFELKEQIASLEKSLNNTLREM